MYKIDAFFAPKPPHYELLVSFESFNILFLDGAQSNTGKKGI